MTEALSFQRARKPEEREQRREAILAAAAELFDTEGPQGAGINAIAARAGFTKSNIYRYFESREEVLMSLFLAELEEFVPALEFAIAQCPENDVAALARVITEGFIARPRLCALTAILSSVLEQNISEAAIIQLKRAMSALIYLVAVALNARLPRAGIEDCSWAVGMVATLVAGMWPTVMSSSTAARVVAMPEFAHLRPAPARDLPRAIAALLASIA